MASNQLADFDFGGHWLDQNGAERSLYARE
jgi:hypothetical protein